MTVHRLSLSLSPILFRSKGHQACRVASDSVLAAVDLHSCRRLDRLGAPFFHRGTAPPYGLYPPLHFLMRPGNVSPCSPRPPLPHLCSLNRPRTPREASHTPRLFGLQSRWTAAAASPIARWATFVLAHVQTPFLCTQIRHTPAHHARACAQKVGVIHATVDGKRTTTRYWCKQPYPYGHTKCETVFE